MQTTPTETSVVKGLVSHGMTKDLSKEIYKFMKEFVSTSANASTTAGKATSARAPQGPEYATKFDLLEVRMALKDDISAVRADLKDEINAVKVEIKDVKNDLLKWFIGLFITLGFTIIGSVIATLQYFIH